MYNIDYYNEKVIANEIINEGSYICTPFQWSSKMYISPNERLGEFINESEDNYNCHLVKVPGIGMSTMYLLEATRNIIPGEQLLMKRKNKE